MSPITTHVLDTSLGRPAEGVRVTLAIQEASGWTLLGRGETDADGRAGRLLAEEHALAPGTYRLLFDVAGYFTRRGVEAYFPQVEIVFAVRSGDEQHHVPLLLSPFGYTTYRGS